MDSNARSAWVSTLTFISSKQMQVRYWLRAVASTESDNGLRPLDALWCCEETGSGNDG